MADPSVALFGPLDAFLAPVVEYVVLGLVLVNVLTRRLANSTYRRQAEEGAEAISRHSVHVFSTWALVAVSLYYVTLHHHSGIVLATLVLGLFLTDFFEFEARKVEAREGEPIERPNAAIVASLVVFLYAAYLSVFFLVAPLWNAVV